jgi:hypothetical protein
LESAFQRYQDQVDAACASGDWNLFADLFAEDATYNEHAYGQMAGREAIRGWIIATMTTFPGNAMTSFPPAWYTVDVEKGWILCDVRNLMTDPGDGSLHEASNITILRYAGDGLWSHEEDAYNPMNFLTMVRAWCAVADRHGHLPDDGRVWLQKFGSL